MAQTMRKRRKIWLKIYLLLPLVSHMAKPILKSAWHHPSPVAEVHWKSFGRNLMTGSAPTAQLFLSSAQLIRVASSFSRITGCLSLSYIITFQMARSHKDIVTFGLNLSKGVWCSEESMPTPLRVRKKSGKVYFKSESDMTTWFLNFF